MTKYKCIFCDKEYTGTKAARRHMKNNHKDEVFDEAWPRYFEEVNG